MKNLMMTVVALTLSAGSAASGAVAYDNFGPGDSYDTGYAHYIVQATTTDFGGISLRHGQQFTSGATGDADTFKFVMGLYEGTPSVTLRLYTDSGSDTIGTQIGTGFTGAFTSDAITVFDISAAGWSLTSGEKYWVTAQAAVNSVITWNGNNINDNSGATDAALGSNATSHNYSPAGGPPLGVFAIEVVPAPASVALLGLGGLMAVRRRR